MPLVYVTNASNTNGANPQIDEMLFSYRIEPVNLNYTYSFDPSTDLNYYQDTPQYSNNPTVVPFSPTLQAWTVYAFNNVSSFSLLTFTPVTQTLSSSGQADLAGYVQIHNSTYEEVDAYRISGDTFGFDERVFSFDAILTNQNPIQYTTQVVGNYDWGAVFHEFAHALGIASDADNGGSGLTRTTQLNNAEWTTGGAPPDVGLTPTTVGAMTFMPYDIQAIQFEYGANYGASHLYSWDSQGNWYIDGVAQPYADYGHVILQSVWDGGANGEYNFAYDTSNATIDMRPGGIINLGQQVATINTYGAGTTNPHDPSHYTSRTADGNIFEPFVDPNNTGETDSLIRRVALGTGSSTVYLNIAGDTVIANTSGSANIVGGGGQDVLELPYALSGYTFQQSGGAWIVRGHSQSFTLNNVALVQGPDSAVALGTFTGLPSGTTGTMLMAQASTGFNTFKMYDLGSDAILGNVTLGRFDPTFQVAGLGRFYGSDQSDIMLRNSSTGVYQVQNFSNNRITNAVDIGTVGTDYTVQGFGNFNGHAGESDMMLRNSSGQFYAYDIQNNTIAASASLGTVGTTWATQGFGDFATNSNETDMMLRNMSTGEFYIYDIQGNAISASHDFGTVGLTWAIQGFGDFSGNANETDMMLRNTSTGEFYIYDIQNNALSAVHSIGTVGLAWQTIGFAPVHSGNGADLLLRNMSTGEIYDYEIQGNALVGATSLGTIGTTWSVAATGVDPSDIGYLVQSMAGFGTDVGLVGPVLTVNDMTAQSHQLAASQQ